MTGQNYLYVDFLQCWVPEQLEDVSLATEIALYFRHDGTPNHTRRVMQHLSDIPSSVDWTRSPGYPDVIPLDVCVWSWVKSEVYRRKVYTRDKLPDQIMEVIARIKERQVAPRRVTRHVLTSCKVHWCWQWNFRKCIVLGKLYQLCHLNNKYRY